MRYVLISDIHGNLEALQAAMSFAKNLEPHQLYCLGDVVGYGADPVDCPEAANRSTSQPISLSQCLHQVHRMFLLDGKNGP